MPRLNPIFLVSTLLLVLLPAPIAGAQTLTFPGCGATLKQCVHAAPPGSTIVLKTNNLIPIPDGLNIHKGLRFVAAKGYKPKVGSNSAPVYIAAELSGAADTFSFKGIRFLQAEVAVGVTSGTGHRVLFENNHISNDTGSNGGAGIQIYFNNTARGSVVVRNNKVSSTGVGIDVRSQGGRAVITNNTVTTPDFGNSQEGISLSGSGSGLVKATVANNLIHDVAGCYCGNPSGILLTAFDTSTFVDLRVLNNTIVRAGENVPAGNTAYGLWIYVSADAKLEASLYNNVVADSYSGIVLYEDAHLAVTGNLNDTFNIGGGDSTGSYDIGTLLHVDPTFVDEAADNFRLQAGSPLRDAGQTCIPSMPIPRSDAGRRFRLFGAAVDIGAYERGSYLSGAVAGVSRSGTAARDVLEGSKGIDVLCGLGGRDKLKAAGGRDFLFGGEGNDALHGGAGADRIRGDLGADKGFGDDGPDRLNMQDGVQGNDLADGGADQDTCVTDPGDVRQSC